MIEIQNVSETFGLNFDVAFSPRGNVKDLYGNIMFCGNFTSLGTLMQNYDNADGRQ
jgi:hypothetical protein